MNKLKILNTDLQDWAKPNLLLWPLFGLGILLLGASIYTELFQAPIGHDSLGVGSNPIPLAYLESPQEIELTNKLGTIKASRKGELWVIDSADEVMANREAIDKVLLPLRDLKVRKVLPYDSINEANFSMGHPLFTLKISSHNPKYNIPIELKLGLINSIDNSAFVALGSSGSIYQVDKLVNSLEAMKASDFIESHIISSDKDLIDKVVVYKARQQTPLLVVKRSKDTWLDSKDRPFAPEKVQHYFEEVLQGKIQFILDKLDDRLAKDIDTALGNPLYTAEITQKNGTIETLTIAQCPSSLGILKVETEKSVLVSAKHRKFPFTIDKGFLNLLVVGEGELR